MRNIKGLNVLTKVWLRSDEHRVHLPLVERDVVQEYVGGAEGDEPVDMNLFLLRVTKDASPQLFVIQNRPSCVLEYHLKLNRNSCGS